MTSATGGPPPPDPIGAPRRLDPLPVQVSKPLVLLRLGYRRPDQVPAKTARMIDEVIQNGAGLLTPKAIWTDAPVSAVEPEAVVVAGVIRSTSRSLRERLAGCRLAALFAATVGPDLEAWARSLMDAGEMTRSLLADAYASSATIALGMEVEAIVGLWMKERGLEACKRYAPGYGDWDLRDQAPLLRHVDAGRIGITLTEDFLMIPAKSISGVIGGRAPD